MLSVVSRYNLERIVFVVSVVVVKTVVIIIGMCLISIVCKLSDLAVIWQSSVHFVCSCGHQTDG